MLMDYSADTHALAHNVDVVSVIYLMMKQKHIAGLNTTNDSVEKKEMGNSVIIKLRKNITLSCDDSLGFTFGNEK